MIDQKWYTIWDIDKLDTPALVIYPDRIKNNISILKGMIDDVSRLRPHVKTHKCKETTLLMLEAGINKFKCATIAEAEMLGTSRAPDVLLAYQPVGPKLERLVELIKTYPETQYSCLVDNNAAAEHISKVALEDSIIIPVFIDLNVGMNRTGVKPEEAIELYAYCNRLPGIKIMGLHAYDGHIHDKEFAVRKQKANEAYAKVEQLQQRLREKGYPRPIIIAGGSPTFPIHAARRDIQCSPGTFIYWDGGYSVNYEEQPFLTAALVVSRVISIPDEGKLCLDVGHKSISAENELTKRIFFLNAPELVFVGQSEEHLIMEAGKDHHYNVGDVFYGLPYHICPTVALYERAVTIENKQIAGEWRNVARDRKITI